MAVPAVLAVGQAAMTAGPVVIDKAKRVWAAATNGKVVDAASAAKFVKDIPTASVIAQGLVAGGMAPDDILPAHVLTNPTVSQLRRSLLSYAASRQTLVDARVPGGSNGAVDPAEEVFFIQVGRLALSTVGSVSRLRALQQVLLTWKDADFDRFEAILKATR